MADAQITLKLTPVEFDVVREALAFAKSNAESVSRDAHTDVKLRSEARKNEVQLADILAKLR